MRADIRRWKKEGRNDILSCLSHLGYGGYDFYDAWFDSETGEELEDCPFLEKIGRGKYVCKIQETKPEVCKAYWCEGSYRLGKRGEMFRTYSGYRFGERGDLFSTYREWLAKTSQCHD